MWKIFTLCSPLCAEKCPENVVCHKSTFVSHLSRQICCHFAKKWPRLRVISINFLKIPNLFLAFLFWKVNRMFMLKICLCKCIWFSLIFCPLVFSNAYTILYNIFYYVYVRKYFSFIRIFHWLFQAGVFYTTIYFQADFHSC